METTAIKTQILIGPKIQEFEVQPIYQWIYRWFTRETEAYVKW